MDKLKAGIDEIIARKRQNTIDNEIPQGTSINMPSHSVWVKPKGEKWVLYGGRDSDKDFNANDYINDKYEDAYLTPNGLSPKEYVVAQWSDLLDKNKEFYDKNGHQFDDKWNDEFMNKYKELRELYKKFGD